MEQLSRDAIQSLMERAEAIEARSLRPGATLWAKRDPLPHQRVSDAPPLHGEAGKQMKAADAALDAALEGIGDSLLMPIGIERRLVRRAEARWASLRGDEALPAAMAAGELLGPPFTSRAMLVSFPDLGAGATARISHVGEAIPALFAAPTGMIAADAGAAAPLASRLVALAHAALRCSAVHHLDSDEDGSGKAASGCRPHLLLRAIALPLAAASNGVSTAVAVVSWRKLLSEDETAALHHELAVAITWMHDHGPGG